MSLYKDHITIYDIALKAGVSTATVSRVMAGKSNVKKETRLKVEKIIKEYQFHPNIIARSLNTKESKSIGILVQELNNPFFINICNEIEACCRKNQYISLIGVSHDNYDLETKILNELEKRQVDGIIFLGGRINHIKLNDHLRKEIDTISKRLPMVFINGNIDQTHCYRVYTDEYQAFQKIIDYVIQCNHKEIALITGQPGLWTSEIKINVFKNILTKHKISINNNWILNGRYTIESAEKNMQYLLSNKKKPSAVICANDTLAIGAIRCAINNGLSVPGDISIVGFDDIFISKYYNPAITTVTQNFSQLARHAVDMIIKFNQGKEPVHEISVGAKLVIRDSCRALSGY